MNEKTEFVLIALVLVVAVIMLPVSVAVLTHGTDPYRVLEGDPVVTAAEKTGMIICSETDAKWDIPGNTGGKIYIISDNCDKPSETIRVETYSFDSAGSRDAAIKAYHSNTIGKNRPHGNMIVLGQHLIFIESPGGSLFAGIAAELDDL